MTRTPPAADAEQAWREAVAVNLEKIAAAIEASQTRWIGIDPGSPKFCREVAQAALTAMLEGFGGDGVTEGDREAAEPIYYASHDFEDQANWLAKNFARHRQLSAAAERARIVAWLRGHKAFSHIGGKFIADAIERGEV